MPAGCRRERAQTYLDGPWMQSLLFYFTAPWQWIAFHCLFLLCCAAFMLGWRTSLVKWIVLFGQISYDYRNITIVYGADSIICCLLFIMCLAPVGQHAEPRPRARRAGGQAPEPGGQAAAFGNALGGRLHPADANPDGGAVLLQRRRESAMGRMVGRRRHLAGLHHL